MLILFPHSQFVLSTAGITYIQAEIKPSPPIVEPEFPWEVPRINLYGSVIKSACGYEMFYQCGNAMTVAYAHSNNGIDWQKPLINETNFSLASDEIVLSPDIGKSGKDKLPENASEASANIEMTNVVAGYHMPSVLYLPDSTMPYKMFAFGRDGYTTLESSDGKGFTKLQTQPSIALNTYYNEHTEKTWCSDVGPCFYDKDKFVAMAKTYIIDDHQRTRRCVGRSESDDFEHWSELKTVWEPGKEDDEVAQSRGYQWADFYGLCPFPYGDGYLGYLWLFEIEEELPRGTNLGKIEVFLASSADGENWQRLSDVPFIPWDLNFGEEGGMVTTPSAPIFDEDEIKVYYSDSNYEHGFAEKDFTKDISEPLWLVRCAQISKERLVGAYADKGSLRIGPLSLNKKVLRLNADCSQGTLTIVYLKDGNVLGQHEVSALDDVNIYIEPLDSQATELEIRLSCVSLFALEVI